MDINRLQKQLNDAGLFNNKKEDIDKPYIYSTDKDTLIIENSEKMLFRISQEGEFFINEIKINIEKEFIESFSILIELLLGESRGSMMKKIRKESKSEIINDLMLIDESGDIYRLVQEIISKWK